LGYDPGVGNKKQRNKSQKADQAPQVAPLSLFSITPISDGNVNHGYVNSLLGIQKACLTVGVPFAWSFIVGNSILVAARNRCVGQFMDETKATHMLFLDADIAVRWEDVMIALVADKDVVAIPCSKRAIDWDRSVKMVRKHPEVPANAIQAVLGHPNFILDSAASSPTKQDEEMGLLEATHAGTGAMIIARRAFEKYQQAFPDRWYLEDVQGVPHRTVEYFRYSRRDNHFIGEDYTFCDDWRSIGGKIYVKLDARSTHVGQINLEYDLAALRALGREG
jgi:hypothetical protein